ncbi:appr-1-p processing protein [Pyrenophora tritici-repentis]|uniref:ADP-ribose 1''-phosphate phosphatase n=1 Tax=Pyrenophora tritici-repentis TaxID=45151 RepID=A0A2W1E4D3_9PLEO|nr:appr-1-p processing protein [Pyrenophora tritici-repentis]KAI0577297.1 appr-1-p processing protein [Pyrenophora tritici-repentis]KAI0607407.1 appr-1-p processing protein [Pyrenophora tritici-repentis]KAI1519158.1 Macro domain containing protein [Pyrenophora tritici-repentis]KAI1574145.1 Macro domain containing protein [Pyrenophora tritici-repentis]
MANSKNSTITSYFAPKDAPSRSPKTNKPINEDSTGNDSKADQDDCPKDKHPQLKRPLSTTTSPPSSKRQDINSTKTTKAKNALPTPLSHLTLPPPHLPPTPTSPTLSLTYHTGPIFTAPPDTLLLHACNTHGVWGSGIALAFKQRYPLAYKIYNTFCISTHHPTSNPVPTGTALLIPPVDRDHGHWVGCLFTSQGYGKKRDGADVITGNTAPSVEMALELVRRVNERVEKEGGEGIKEVRMCRVNSGKFGVEWGRSARVIEGIKVREGWVGSVQVWDPETK